ncbi:MAG: hypothetical protein ACREXT_10610, partial [Gammaproteobacteria bacterium]
ITDHECPLRNVRRASLSSQHARTGEDAKRSEACCIPIHASQFWNCIPQAADSIYPIDQIAVCKRLREARKPRMRTIVRNDA